MAPAVMRYRDHDQDHVERGSLRVSRARCWAVESRVMNEASVEEEPGESSGEYAMGERDFRMISQEFRPCQPCANAVPAAALLTFP